MYSVKEIYYTLQGEGAQTGRAAVFLRFAGCNLWSGLERDREKATCQFCDTDFVGTDGPGGGKFADAHALAEAVAKAWAFPLASFTAPGEVQDEEALPHKEPLSGSEKPPSSPSSPSGEREGKPYVVITGGEPLLQLDAPLIDALHAQGFEIGIETNGTILVPPGIDWICVSPKAGAELMQKAGNELKLVFPQPGAEPERFEHLDFEHFFVQPMDGPQQAANIKAAAAFCLTHPRWRLSLQTHKLIGLR